MLSQAVQRTLFTPLLGRARAARLWPHCFQDAWAQDLAQRMTGRMPELAAADLGDVPAAIYALRHRAAVTEVRRYLRDHPGAAVVDLGCGMDRLVDGLDAPAARVYCLDLPEVMSLRREWLPPHPRERELPASLTDTDWMADVDADAGMIAVASGVVYFFAEEDVRRLVDELSHRFPGGGIVYDAESPDLVAASEQAVHDAGVADAPMPYRVEDPLAPLRWSRAVGTVRADYGLLSYLPDDADLPAAVMQALEDLREHRSLYEVVADFVR
ncbi:class I SAM-dependent methyltransferase [Actinomyces sp. Z16]|uniref:class I SAM-dependent methyltransferase n=1 Tax=Actinomyces sp. Z16 TaxID=2079536 RepID=UPI000D59A3EE|nr:class I SAM-dependent methyltransferase [Actinomyces sp. Z16]RAX23713.1 methyltransferase [Actinomyces sp. Z3]